MQDVDQIRQGDQSREAKAWSQSQAMVTWLNSQKHDDKLGKRWNAVTGEQDEWAQREWNRETKYSARQ